MNETVEIMKYEERVPVFHLKNNDLLNKSKEVPQRLFDLYVQQRTDFLETSRRIERYFKPLKDKPMIVTKNHVQPGEIHRFNDDGTVEIIK